MNLLVFAQLLGLISFGLGIACFYQRDDQRLKKIMVVMNLNNALHFMLLGGVTACISSLLSAARTALALRVRSALLAGLFIALTLALGLPWVDSAPDWLPMVGSCIGSYAIFCLSGIKLRYAFTAGATCWLANNLWLGSIGGSLLEATLLLTNLRTIYRLRKEASPQTAQVAN